ncbi:MAG: VWA domain-containing protein [Balneolaceae bacterium]
MSFLNPLFLFALISVGIPLLIYLLNLRKPKKVRFSTLAFFESLKSTSLRKIKIKRWLLLAVRMLAVAALALALANPFLPSGMGLMNSGEPVIIGIVVDNSPGMGQIDRNGPYLEQAKDAADQLIGMQESDTRFVLNRTNGESLTLPYLSKAAAGREVADLEIVRSGNYTHQTINEVVRQLENAPEPNKILYILSDGQLSQFGNIEQLGYDDPKDDIMVRMLQLGDAEPANIGIRNVEVESSEGEIYLRASVMNYGNQRSGSRFFNVTAGDELIAQEMVDISGGETEEFRFEMPQTDDQALQVTLEVEGDELVFDNTFYSAIQLPEQRNVLYVGESRTGNSEFRSYLKPLLEASAENNDRFRVEFDTVDELSPDRFQEMDAIVLDGLSSIPDYLSQAIIEQVQAGTGLLLLPAAEGSIQNYNRLLSLSDAGQYTDLVGSYGSFERNDQLSPPEEGHPVLDGMFELQSGEEVRVNLPELFYYYRINTVEGQASVPILTSRTGNVILNEVDVGNGTLVLSAIGSDPGWSNFPVKPLFAPLFYRTVDYLAGGEEAVLNNHQLGTPFDTTLSGAVSGSVQINAGDDELIPSTRQTFSGLNVFYEAREWQPGWKTLTFGDTEQIFASNIDAMESNLETLTEQELENLFTPFFNSVQVSRPGGDSEELSTELASASIGKEIWHFFIIAAIILLLLESMISRHYKAETIS